MMLCSRSVFVTRHICKRSSEIADQGLKEANKKIADFIFVVIVSERRFAVTTTKQRLSQWVLFLSEYICVYFVTVILK